MSAHEDYVAYRAALAASLVNERPNPIHAHQPEQPAAGEDGAHLDVDVEQSEHDQHHPEHD